MKNVNARIRELLDRNVFLKPEVKAQLLAADPQTQADILPTLEAMDREQTAAFRKAVKGNPDFFKDWEAAVLEHEAGNAATKAA